MIYLQFLWSLLQHKYWVLVAGLRLGGIPLWRLLVHDWQKFTPIEFIAYARYFKGGKQNPVAFMYAWHHHVKHGPHHWAHWYLHPGYDFADAVDGCLPIPDTYIREMAADLMGASKTYTGSWAMDDWLAANLDSFYLHPTSRGKLLAVLAELGYVV